MSHINATAIALLFCVAGVAYAPLPAAHTQSPTPAAPPAARPADVASPEAILAATYDTISGPAGTARNWDRFQSLFVPGARLIAVSGGRGGPLQSRVMTPDEYVARSRSALESQGFFERSISNHTDRFGSIAQVFSTYESRHDAKDAQPFARGINSFQLFNDGARWWIVTIYWQAESAADPIPAQFLPGRGN